MKFADVDICAYFHDDWRYEVTEPIRKTDSTESLVLVNLTAKNQASTPQLKGCAPGIFINQVIVAVVRKIFLEI